MKTKSSGKQKNMASTFDRLSSLDVGSELSFDYENDNKLMQQNQDINKFILQGQRAPRAPDTYSEINDPADKDAIYNHSVKTGVFRKINESPLRQRMPASMQMYMGDSQN
jgi:hypothetical protein